MSCKPEHNIYNTPTGESILILAILALKNVASLPELCHLVVNLYILRMVMYLAHLDTYIQSYLQKLEQVSTEWSTFRTIETRKMRPVRLILI